MTGLELLLQSFLFGVFVLLFLVYIIIRNTISPNRYIVIYQLFFLVCGSSIGNPAECAGETNDFLNIYIHIFSVHSLSFQVYSIK